MRTIHQWLDEYGASHRNPTNKLLHWLCVPVITLCVIGLLASLPVPAAAGAYPWLNWGTLFAVAALAWYVVVSPRLAIGMVAVFLAILGVLDWMQGWPLPLWQSCLAAFVIAWIGQFIGHAIEGQRPSFFKDLQFLLVGPLWLLAFVYRRLGLKY